jgi:hypothetical protein
MLSTIIVSLLMFGFFIGLPVLALLASPTEPQPDCHTGGDRHEWYNKFGNYMCCAAHEERLPGDRVSSGNNGTSHPRGWSYRFERSCLACDRREYHAGYVETGKVNDRGLPELETQWLPVPGHEGSITNHGYANYHRPGVAYDSEGFRI